MVFQCCARPCKLEVVACEAPRSKRKSVCLMFSGERDICLKTADAPMATKIERRPVTVMMSATLVGDQGGTAVPGLIVQFNDLTTFI